MFRRRWSGLPEDPVYPTDLKELGYFVDQDSDEIRQVSAPTYYFNYFISKNIRHNDRQRFAFTAAVQDQVIHPRLDSLGLVKLALPLGTPAREPHVDIYISRGLERKKRVVVIFGEPEQELGVIAHRVIGGRGGVDKGSMAGVVRALQAQKAKTVGDNHNDDDYDDDDDDDDGSPGCILANTGELWWWPEGGRGLSPRQSQAVPMRSCVHWGRFYDPAANAVPDNASVDQHVACVFETVLGSPDLVAPGAEVQVVGVAGGADAAQRYLARNWARWAGKVGCLAMLGTVADGACPMSEEFRVFLREKSRIYITCQEPLGTAISGPDGNPNTTLFTSYGCPVYSSGESFYGEMALVRAKDAVLSWLEEAHRAGRGYANPQLEVTFADEEVGETEPWVTELGDLGPDSRSGAGADADAGGRCEGGHMHPGLEIITREKWEARMEREGKDDNATVPDDVYVVGRDKDS